MTVYAAERRGDWMTTFTGRRFWPLDPRPEDVCLEDIAHALARQCRFAGHTREFYSVAQHSVIVSQSCDPQDALWGLLHDASEAYLSDLVRPVKHDALLDGYRTVEDAVMRSICAAFGLGREQPPSVTRADRAVLGRELRDVVNLPAGYTWPASAGSMALLEAWRSELAERVFLERYQALTRRREGGAA